MANQKKRPTSDYKPKPKRKEKSKHSKTSVKDNEEKSDAPTADKRDESSKHTRNKTSTNTNTSTATNDDSTTSPPPMESKDASKIWDTSKSKHRSSKIQTSPSGYRSVLSKASPEPKAPPSTMAAAMASAAMAANKPSVSEITSTNPPATLVVDNAETEYRLLLTPMFSAMTRITSHLFLTGVGGMTKENFRKNHIDYVVNITVEAPFWDDIESMRLALEDEVTSNILPYFDVVVDKIEEVIRERNAHVLVHCLAGVSRSASIVLAYLMKYKRMKLKEAFNYCYKLRPVIRPNNGFMTQLIEYEKRLFNENSVQMVDVEVENTPLRIPNFFLDEHPGLVVLELMRTQEALRKTQREVSEKKTRHRG